eukprot:gene10090-biopygen3467
MQWHCTRVFEEVAEQKTLEWRGTLNATSSGAPAARGPPLAPPARQGEADPGRPARQAVPQRTAPVRPARQAVPKRIA